MLPPIDRSQKELVAPRSSNAKQARPDLRKDNYLSVVSRARLETVYRRRQILEKNLRIHYPTLRGGDSLFPEWNRTILMQLITAVMLV